MEVLNAAEYPGYDTLGQVILNDVNNVDQQMVQCKTRSKDISSENRRNMIMDNRQYIRNMHEEHKVILNNAEKTSWHGLLAFADGTIDRCSIEP